MECVGILAVPNRCMPEVRGVEQLDASIKLNTSLTVIVDKSFVLHAIQRSVEGFDRVHLDISIVDVVQ